MDNQGNNIGTHYEDFVRQQVASGRFSSREEALRAGLRLLEEEEARRALLIAALEEGEKSGNASYDLESFIRELDA